MWLFAFAPVDSWFFRDGTSFSDGATAATGIHSSFPPGMASLQGAARAAIAMTNGWRWQDVAHWPHDLGSPDRPGPLKLWGPLIYAGGRWRWPMPQVVWTDEQDRRTGRLRVGGRVTTDMGTRAYPRWEPGARLGQGWVDAATLGRMLADPGAVPSDVATQLYEEEQHVGIQREARVVLEGALYSVHHARPLANVAVGMLVDGVPADVELPTRMMVRLGGEARLAELSVETVEWDEVWPRPAMPLSRDGATGQVRFLVTLLTPARFADPQAVALEGPPNVPGVVVAAHVGRPRLLGGFDLQRRASRPLEPMIPAGSVWFKEAPAASEPEIWAAHGQVSGSRVQMGEGLVAIGRWEGSQ